MTEESGNLVAKLLPIPLDIINDDTKTVEKEAYVYLQFLVKQIAFFFLKNGTDKNPAMLKPPKIYIGISDISTPILCKLNPEKTPSPNKASSIPAIKNCVFIGLTFKPHLVVFLKNFLFNGEKRCNAH